MKYPINHPKNRDVVEDDHYLGLPLATPGRIYRQYQLECALATIQGAQENSDSLIVIRALLDTTGHSPAGCYPYSLNVIMRFITFLRARILKSQHRKAQHKNVRRKAHVDFIWSCSQQSKNPQFKLMLLLNKEAFYGHGKNGYSDADTLQFIIRSTWATVLNMPQESRNRLVTFPARALSFVRNEPDDFALLFQRASSLCLVPEDWYGIGAEGFGSSRS
jgi:hypothetical protein